MKLNNCNTAIFVKEIEISKNFYRNILGLEIDLDFGKNVVFKSSFAIWEIQKNHIIPSTLGVDNIITNSVNRFELYFETDNIDVIYSELKNRKVSFLHEIHEEPWGQRTIRFFDPDNHLIEIGESLIVFVSRFHEQGKSVEEINKKTSVPVEEIRKILML
ncbi:MAG TPA: VOC family protein [Bacteroidales bacterium]|nr:VOC family protein [Bacteroidales bacterium]